MLNLLSTFMDGVQRLCETMVGPAEHMRSVDIRRAMEAISTTHDVFYSALGDWVGRHTPGFGYSGGRNDPSRGGFAALNLALHDGFQATCLAHVALLAMSFHATQLADDDQAYEVEKAYEIAVQWYDEAVVFAKSITDDIRKRSSRFNKAVLTIYCDRIPDDTRATFRVLQPYLDDVNRLPTR